jgi:hypothetical protein
MSVPSSLRNRKFGDVSMALMTSDTPDLKLPPVRLASKSLT